MHQFITIKRAPQEVLTNFNLRFQWTWQRIPLSTRPPTDMAFVFYLKAFNSNISVMIQSPGANTLLQAFDIVVQAENNLIDVGKLTPHHIMPVFLEISPQVLEEATPSTSILQSIYSYPTPPLSSLVAEVSDMKNLLRSFSNEIFNLKRDQVSPAKPPFQQSFQGNRPPYQHNQHTNHRTHKPS